MSLLRQHEIEVRSFKAGKLRDFNARVVAQGGYMRAILDAT
jgi:hypothetical protein